MTLNLRIPMCLRYNGSPFYVDSHDSHTEKLVLCKNRLYLFFDFPKDLPFDLLILSKEFDSSYKCRIINNYFITLEEKYRTIDISILCLDILCAFYKIPNDTDFYVGIEY